MTAITIDDVKRLADLSALSITDQEADALRAQLEAILGYVKQLDEVDTTGKLPTYQVTDLENVVRDDEVVMPDVAPSTLLHNVPNVEDGHIKVRRVL